MKFVLWLLAAAKRAQAEAQAAGQAFLRSPKAGHLAPIPGSSAGQGGEGGEGGSGGKILIASLNVITGQKFQYAAAQPAGNSTFGELSSASGETSADGYYDLVTQTFFGRKGANGIKGGNGGSPGNNGQAVGDYLGGYGINSKTVSQTKYGTSGTVTANGWGGGGAAQGANGATSAGEVYINLQSLVHARLCAGQLDLALPPPLRLFPKPQ